MLAAAAEDREQALASLNLALARNPKLVPAPFTAHPPVAGSR
jgi:hypothetical protein